MPRLPLRRLSALRNLPASVPLAGLAALAGFSYALAAGWFTARVLPQAQLAWWLYPLLAAAAVSGAALPLLQGEHVAVGRFVVGGAWSAAPVVIGTARALAGGGWAVDELLLQSVLPGALLLVGFVVATTLGDGLAVLVPHSRPESAAEDARAAEGARRAVRILLHASFKAWLLQGLFAFVAAEVLLGAAAAAPAAAVAAAVGLAANLALLGLVHLQALRYGWRAAGDGFEEQVNPLPWTAMFLVAGVAVALSLVAPADVSPISRQGLHTFLVRFTEFVGPFFVSARRGAAASGGSGTAWERLVQLFLPSADSGGASGASALSLAVEVFLALAFLAVTGYALWRFMQLARLRRGEAPDTGPGYGDRGLLAEIFLWLRDLLRSLFGRLARWAGRLAAGGEAGEAPHRRRRIRRGVTDKDLAGHPARRIRLLFALLLRDLRRQGYPREAVETAYEYAARVRRVRPDVAHEMDDVVRIYVQARYSPEDSLSVLERAYQALRAAVDRLRRAIRRKSADPR